MSEIWLIIFRIVFILIFILALIPVLVLLERKISAFIQDRPGPNRANIAGIRLGGLIQAMADALKLAIKEDFTPAAIRSKVLFTIAPMVLFLWFFQLTTCFDVFCKRNLQNPTGV